jgi:hypothetical protein
MPTISHVAVFAISISPRSKVQRMVEKEGENLLLDLQEKNLQFICYVTLTLVG